MLECIRSRRSIRTFEDRPIEPEKIAALLEAARLAPSSINLQPFRVIVVDDPEGLAAVRAAAYGWGAVMTAPVITVCMADLEADGRVESQIGELFEVGALEQVDVGALRSGEGKPFSMKLGDKMAAVNAAIATEHMVLEAVNQGLGTCWVHHFEHDEVRRHFSIPDNLELLTLLPVGYPAENPDPRPRIADVRFVPPAR